MSIPEPNESNPLADNKVVLYALQLLALALLLLACFRIVEPFITPFIWGSVLAIALYPLHSILRHKLKGSNAWSASIITILMLLLIIGPSVWLLLGTVGEFKELVTIYRSGNLHIPPPNESVKDWPLIGATLFSYWTDASTNITNFITQHREELKPFLLKLLDLAKSTGSGIAVLTVSIIISGFLLVYAKGADDFIRALLSRIVGKAGASMADSAALTVRNVAKGVLGVAVIQSILAGIGFVLAGIPLAGLWIIICLILAIVQVGILPVSLGVIIYAWGNSDALTATLLTVWMIIVGVMDNVLKPILLGRGAPAPMLVVFVGAIGGFMVSGFIGLFTGAIILTLGYKLMTGWVLNQSLDESPQKE